MCKLILDWFLHLCLDLAAFFFAFLDQLWDAIVCSDEDTYTSFEKLSFRFLVLALVSLSLELELDSLDFAHQVSLFISVAE